MDESQPIQKVYIASYTIFSDLVAIKIIFWMYILGGISAKNFKIIIYWPK
jgi:hypothetical protein